MQGLAAGTELKPIKKVGVLGAGTMGGGISMNFANVGIAVTIVEVQQAALDRGLGVIQKNYQNSADKGRFPAGRSRHPHGPAERHAEPL